MHIADNATTCDKGIAQHDSEMHAESSGVVNTQIESASNVTGKDTVPVDAGRNASDTNINSES